MPCHTLYSVVYDGEMDHIDPLASQAAEVNISKTTWAFLPLKRLIFLEKEMEEEG
jgi:hypothetical protein